MGSAVMLMDGLVLALDGRRSPRPEVGDRGGWEPRVMAGARSWDAAWMHDEIRRTGRLVR